MNPGSNDIMSLEECFRLGKEMWFVLSGLNLGFPSHEHIFFTPATLVILERLLQGKEIQSNIIRRQSCARLFNEERRFMQGDFRPSFEIHESSTCPVKS
jgi:hypothetical protein